MPTVDKIYSSIMDAAQDRNIRFTDLQKLLDYFNFECRIKGDHFVYTLKSVQEIINIQPDGNKAKSYQVKQIRTLLTKYKLKVKV